MIGLLGILTLVFFTLWVLILHAAPERIQLFLCRHQWLFLLIHVPVMGLIASIMGEGMLAGAGSLAGGLLGQIYLALRGMRRFGLTFLGKPTDTYYKLYPGKVKKKKGMTREELARRYIAVNMPFLVASAEPPHQIHERVAEQNRQ